MNPIITTTTTVKNQEPEKTDHTEMASVYDSSLVPKRHEVSLSALTSLYGQIVQYCNRTSTDHAQFESKLMDLGIPVGQRLVELLNFRASLQGAGINTGNMPANGSGSARSDSSKDQPTSIVSSFQRVKGRDLEVLDILQFVHSSVWNYLFLRPSDDLVKSSERTNEYMIVDYSPSLPKFVASPRLAASCNYYVVGILKGFLTDAGFPCKVSAHPMAEPEHPDKVVFLVQFEEEVLERESLRGL